MHLVNDPASNMSVTGEPDESTVVLEFGRRSLVSDICFDGKRFEDCLATLDQLLNSFTKCRIITNFTKNIFLLL